MLRWLGQARAFCSLHALSETNADKLEAIPHAAKKCNFRGIGILAACVAMVGRREENGL